MRSHWMAELPIQDTYVLKGDDLHHLVNVIRIEAGEELLLLNGKGLSVKTRVDAISKREMKLAFIDQCLKKHAYNFDLAIGMPKREALELCLKQATELGFRKIYLIRSDYSQMRFPETERLEKLLIAALEQSNAPYLPETFEASFEGIPWKDYSEVLLLDSQTKVQHRLEHQETTAPRLLIIGPEGGFSPKELSFLHAQNKIKVINLPTPILRTPTALSVGAGIMLESLLK